jgi:hypothetical protein
VGFSSPVTSLDRIRFVTSGVDEAAFAGRVFDYVILRDFMSPEPVVTSAAEQSHAVCP